LFALICLAIATPISATIGVGSLGIAGYADLAQAGYVWMTWWLGDLAGALVVTPVLILWATAAASPTVPSDGSPAARRPCATAPARP
jgi:integral membrane sensor domain MASE1